MHVEALPTLTETLFRLRRCSTLTRLYKAGEGGGLLIEAQQNPIEAGKASLDNLQGEINITFIVQ